MQYWAKATAWSSQLTTRIGCNLLLPEHVADSYDYIEGGVANDRVIDTVYLYMAGLMDENTALLRLSQHQPNNQMCILSQELINKYLVFDGTEAI